MRKLLVTPRVCLDLLDIWHFIASENIEAAIRVGGEFESTLRGLGEFQGKGHARPDVTDRRIRFWRLYAYMIAYRYDDESVTIIRVVHGRRNLRQLFKK